MIKQQKVLFRGRWVELPSTFLLQLDSAFGRIYDRSDLTPLEVREFIDATAAAVTRNLPDGNKSPDKDYYFQKVDVSANAVTINAFGTQLIGSSGSMSLAAQFDDAYLMWDTANQAWYVR